MPVPITRGAFSLVTYNCAPLELWNSLRHRCFSFAAVLDGSPDSQPQRYSSDLSPGALKLSAGAAFIIPLLYPALHPLRSPFNYEIRRTPRTAGDARPGVVFRAPTHALIGARIQLLRRLQTHAVHSAWRVPGRRTAAGTRGRGGRRTNRRHGGRRVARDLRGDGSGASRRRQFL